MKKIISFYISIFVIFAQQGYAMIKVQIHDENISQDSKIEDQGQEGEMYDVKKRQKTRCMQTSEKDMQKLDDVVSEEKKTGMKRDKIYQQLTDLQEKFVQCKNKKNLLGGYHMHREEKGERTVRTKTMEARIASIKNSIRLLQEKNKRKEKINMKKLKKEKTIIEDIVKNSEINSCRPLEHMFVEEADHDMGEPGKNFFIDLMNKKKSAEEERPASSMDLHTVDHDMAEPGRNFFIDLMNKKKSPKEERISLPSMDLHSFEKEVRDAWKKPLMFPWKNVGEKKASRKFVQPYGKNIHGEG